MMKMRSTPEELSAIKLAMEKEKLARVYKRYQALYLFLSGRTCKEISDLIGITSITVCNIHRAYKKGGLAVIPDKSKPGRPSRLTQDQRNELKQVILKQAPSDVGFLTSLTWTANLIGKYIQREYGCTYSVRGITGMLARMGFSYIHPTYVLAKAQLKQDSFVQDFETAQHS